MSTPHDRPSDEPMLDVAHGDPADNHLLRQALTQLSEVSDDPEFQALVGDVLAGRASLRDVAFSEVMGRVIGPLAEQGAAQYDALSDEERRQLAEQGEQQLAELREQLHSDDRQ